MKRTLFPIVCFLITGFAGYSQNIKLKNGKVIIDKEVRFGFERRSRNEMIVRPLNAPTDELVSIIWNNNGTYDSEDDFLQIVFSRQLLKLESARLKDEWSVTLLKMMINDGVLDIDGSINEEKLQTFFLKYDENITNRRIR